MVGRNHDSEPISGLTARANAATVSCDTSLVLVVSGGVDCGRRRRDVYEGKPQRYAKDNRTAHLTARSHKSVAYIKAI